MWYVPSNVRVWYYVFTVSRPLLSLSDHMWFIAIILSGVMFLLGTPKSLYGLGISLARFWNVTLACVVMRQSLRLSPTTSMQKEPTMYYLTYSRYTATVLFVRLYSPGCWNVVSDLNVAPPCSRYFNTLSFHSPAKRQIYRWAYSCYFSRLCQTWLIPLPIKVPVSF